jgi:hypothetical protein
MIKICTERSKASVLVSVFNAESGEKTFKAIVIFLNPIVKILVENLVFRNPQVLQYFSISGRKIIFYLNKSYIFGFSASNCIEFHKKIHKKKFARVLHCVNLT